MTYVYFSESTTTNEAEEAKHAFEQYAETFGIKIQKYHAETSAFNNRVVKEITITVNKTSAFSGVDIHQQN